MLKYEFQNVSTCPLKFCYLTRFLRVLIGLWSSMCYMVSLAASSFAVVHVNFFIRSNAADSLVTWIVTLFLWTLISEKCIIKHKEILQPCSPQQYGGMLVNETALFQKRQVVSRIFNINMYHKTGHYVTKQIYVFWFMIYRPPVKFSGPHVTCGSLGVGKVKRKTLSSWLQHCTTRSSLFVVKVLDKAEAISARNVFLFKSSAANSDLCKAALDSISEGKN